MLVFTFFIGCGAESETQFDLFYTGSYFKIPYNQGFTTSSTKTGVEIYNDSYSVIVEAREYTGASLDEIESITTYTDTLKNNLTKLEESNWNDQNTSGVIMSGYADNKRGIALVVPLNDHIVSVFTKETPKIDSDFEEAKAMIEGFELTDVDFFKNNPIAPDDITPDEDNNSTDNGGAENGDTVINSGDTSKIEAGDSYSNTYISTVLPKGWELTADDDVQTVFGSTGEFTYELLALSIQYVTLEKDTQFSTFVSDFSEQVGGKPRVAVFGNKQFEYVRGVHANYSEFHIFSKHSSGIPIIITAITADSVLPPEVVFILENTKVK